MIAWNGGDYWKLLDQHGVFHLYGDATGQHALCNRDIKPANMPGTFGKETALTCIRCTGLSARTSSSARPGSPA